MNHPVISKDPFSSVHPMIVRPRLLALLAFSALLLPAARAQSVWGGTMTWTQIESKKVNIEITRTIRRGLFPTANVGDTIATGAVLNYGDNGTTDPLNLVVRSVDPTRDKLVASAVFPHTYTFTGSKGFTAFSTTCCRPTAAPGAGGSGIEMRLSAEVKLAEGVPFRSSPRVYLPSQVLYAPTGAPFSFTIPGSDPDRDSFAYRFATTAECSLPNPAPTGATLDANTGVFTLPAQPAAIRQFTQVILDDGEGTSSVDLAFSFAPYASAPPAFTTLPAGGNVSGYPGLNTDFQIVATDPGTTANDPTDIFYGTLPQGLSVLSSVPSGPVGNIRTLTLRWTPNIEYTAGTDIPVTFTAINAVGEAAITTIHFKVALADLVYLSGAIRDFSVAHSDFGVPDGDAATRFVQTQLGADGKPVFLPAPGISSASAATFPAWWDVSVGVPPSEKTVFSIILSNAFQTNPRVHEYSNSSFYPIDGQLLGNEGAPHNSYFTWQAHSYIAADAGASLTVKSSDDLWVFIDGRLVVDMGGVHGLETATIAMDTLVDVEGLPLPPLADGLTFRRFDIFFAHRGQHTPQLTLQLLPPVTCETIDTTATIDPQTFTALGRASVLADGNLQLIGPNVVAADSSAAWLDSPRLPVSQGFKLGFDFEMSAGLPGFAMVLSDPANGLSARGGDSGNLGYAGIPGCLAIEFDAARDTVLNDPAFTGWPDHVSVHSAGAQPNGANENFSLGSARLEDQAGSGYTVRHLNDGAVHHILVEVLPDREITTPRFFSLRVWMDVTSTLNQPPLLETRIDLAQMAVMTGDPTGQSFKRFLLGFTASTGATGSGANGKLKVRNFTLTTAEPLKSLTKLISASPTTVTAGQLQNSVAALVTKCNERMTAPGYASGFSATLTHVGGGETTPVGITDMGEGSYVLDYRPMLLGQWTLNASFQGSPLPGMPQTFTVISPYAAWAATAFPVDTPADQRDSDDDPDGDGVINGLEFVTGGNPVAAALAFTTERSATELILSYPRVRSVPAGADRPQLSDALDTWAPAPGLQREVLPLDATRDTIRLHLPIGPELQHFLRVAFDEGAY